MDLAAPDITRVPANRAATACGTPRCSCRFLPAKAMLPVGLPNSVVQRVRPWQVPAEYGPSTPARRIGGFRTDGEANVVSVLPETPVHTRWVHRVGELREVHVRD